MIALEIVGPDGTRVRAAAAAPIAGPSGGKEEL